MNKVAELVFIPAPAVGHLVSEIEFANRLLDRDDRFSVTILVMESPLGSDIAAFTESVETSGTDSRIRFIHLPRLPLPPLLESVESYLKDFIDSYKTYVKDAVIEHVLSNPNSGPLAGLVIDMFCTSMIDVGNELGVPSYLFFTSGAAFLGFMLYLPTRYEQVGKEFEESDADSIISTYVNPLPTRVFPLFAFNKRGGYTAMMNHGRRFKETEGIIVNTYAELESHAVNSLLNIDHLPPLYTVGPLIDLKGRSQLRSDRKQRDEIMKWLDNQPASSVVFLCFGSMGSFGEEQVKEIAVGLEQSGNRFLWSLRKPPPRDKLEEPTDYTSDLQEVLPNGFLERTNGIGMVCGWAPQQEVLAHISVGGFVSHCGWNSILESLWYGVPIVTWPMYAEQQLNAFELVKDLGLAVEMRLDYKRNISGEIVLADEITNAVGRLMDGNSKVRNRVKEFSEKSRLAVKSDGSSCAAFGSLIEDLVRNIS